ncbi:MAG TPA: NAD(P) transhydrogenase subunit alpha [Pyrinomonadaceae bacterium]|jgi:NAD(P) transhydrogenase subunit alpha
MIFMILIASETRFTAESLIPAFYVFALAAFLGYQVISRVPPLLHTPLMSATNAISGISLVGSIVTAGAQYNRVSTILGFTAVTCATINVVGGFMITDRMLRMFKRKIPAGKETKELGAKETEKLASGNGDGAKQ